jgi:hypothetical protein
VKPSIALLKIAFLILLLVGLGWLFHALEKPTTEQSERYDLCVMSVDSSDGLPNEGRNLVIVALVGTDLHIRIFDANGKRAVDKAENELISGETLTTLKKQLNPLPKVSGLSPEQKQKLIQDVTSIAGHAQSENSSPVIDFLNGSLVSNYVVEVSAALMFLLASFIFKRELKHVADRVLRPRRKVIRLPAMIATAPLMLGVEKHLWRDANIELILDWRYAGRDALLSLSKGECHLAVAADYAVVKFMAERREKRDAIALLPFVVIKDNIRIVTRNSGLDRLQRGAIAFYKNSVHEEVLYKLQPALINTGIPETYPGVKNVKEGLWTIFEEINPGVTADGFLLWEPHYAAFEDTTGLSVMDPLPTAGPYVWTLCVVALAKDIEKDAGFASGFASVLAGLCAECKSNRSEVIQTCAEYLSEELLGIDEDKIRRILEKNGHEFGISQAMTSLESKLQDWDNWPTVTGGAGMLRQRINDGSLWLHVKLEDL